MTVRSVWGPESLASAQRSKSERIKHKRTKANVVYPNIIYVDKSSITYPNFETVAKQNVNTNFARDIDEGKQASFKCGNHLGTLPRSSKSREKLVSKENIRSNYENKSNFLEENEINEQLKIHYLKPSKMQDTNRKRTQNKFKLIYDRGDLPVCIRHSAKRKLQWKMNLKELDFHYYLPIFFEGVSIAREPYSFLAFRGSLAMMEYMKSNFQVAPKATLSLLKSILHDLVFLLKAALVKKKKVISTKAMIILQTLSQMGPTIIDHQRRNNCGKNGIQQTLIGTHLTKYYKHVLPQLNAIILLERRKIFLDQIDYKQIQQVPFHISSRNVNKITFKICDRMVDLAMETLSIFEATGGSNSKQIITKYVPQYDSFNKVLPNNSESTFGPGATGGMSIL